MAVNDQAFKVMIEALGVVDDALTISIASPPEDTRLHQSKILHTRLRLESMRTQLQTALADARARKTMPGVVETDKLTEIVLKVKLDSTAFKSKAQLVNEVQFFNEAEYILDLLQKTAAVIFDPWPPKR